MTTSFRIELERLVENDELQLIEDNRLADGSQELVCETQDDLDRVSLIRIYQLPVGVDVGAGNRQQK